MPQAAASRWILLTATCSGCHCFAPVVASDAAATAASELGTPSQLQNWQRQHLRQQHQQQQQRWHSGGGDSKSLDPPPPAHCRRSAVDFSHARLITNNLGGLGPGGGAPVLVYEDVGKLSSGNPIKVIVSNTSAYIPVQSRLHNKWQGLHGPFGAIGVASGSTVDIRLRFLDGVTGKPATLENVILTVVDLDKDGPNQTSSLGACGASAYYLSDATEPPLKPAVQVLPDLPRLFCTTFRAQLLGKLDDEPQGPSTLSDLQRSKSVSLQFSRRQEVTLALTVTDEGEGGRSGHFFLFAGSSSVDGCLRAGTTTTTTTDTMTSTTMTVTSSTSTRSSTNTMTATSSTSTQSSTRTTSSTIHVRSAIQLPPSTTTITSQSQSPSTSTATLGATKTALTTHGTTPVRWNCSSREGSGAWSKAKQDWCCKHQQIGCRSKGVERMSDEEYDCNSGRWQWRLAWSEEKKYVCCTKEHFACEAFAPKQALQGGAVSNGVAGLPPALQPVADGASTSIGGMPTWRAPALPTLAPLPALPQAAALYTLPPPSLDWVEAAPSTSLTPTGPFNCQEGLDNWRSDWSRWKRSWCCSREQLGCEYDCTGEERLWPEAKRLWCCTFRGMGCQVEQAQQKFERMDGDLQAVVGSASGTTNGSLPSGASFLTPATVVFVLGIVGAAATGCRATQAWLSWSIPRMRPSRDLLEPALLELALE